MTTSDLIATDPGAFRKVLETPAGAAWHVAGLNRYLIELARPLAATADQDTIPTRELWTNSLHIACAQLGVPPPGAQLDILTEVEQWSA